MGEQDWLYCCHVELPSDFLEADIISLCFDGLDTFATLWLNGHQILVSDNIFVPHCIRCYNVNYFTIMERRFLGVQQGNLCLLCFVDPLGSTCWTDDRTSLIGCASTTE